MYHRCLQVRTGFTLSKQLKNRLEETSDKTGLSQSEIIRRGTLEEVNKLEEKA
ncbi:MAG: ribbon-helix-helix protein, CopG family [Candidatus Nanosalina sp.]